MSARGADRPEVVIFGAGPGGLSAALWCADLGLSCVVLDSNPLPGGQLALIPHKIKNAPGMPEARGEELLRAMLEQARDAEIPMRLGCAASLDSYELAVTLGDEVLRPLAVVIATGVRRRTLDIAEPSWIGDDWMRSNAGADLTLYRDQRVAIIGGGDDALVHAALLAPVARELWVIHRRPAPTARLALRRAAGDDPRIRWLSSSIVTGFAERDGERALRLSTPEGPRLLPVDRVITCLGPRPNSEGFGVACRQDGAVVVDRLQRSSRAGVFAVGDVCCSEAPTLSAAIGQGSTAAKVISAMRDGNLHITPQLRHARDVLRLRGLRLPASIGAYPREREVPQTLRFDLEFSIDAAAAAHSDRLEDTLDYSSVAQAIGAVLERQHHQLIETVANSVALELLARFAIESVEVAVTKPAVPQLGSEASVTVRRRRDEG